MSGVPRRVLLASSFVILICGSCAPQQSKQANLDTIGFDRRSVVYVAANISNSTTVSTSAYTKEEGRDRGASAGASGAALGWAQGGELAAYTLFLAPVVIPVTIAIGAGVGAVSGSAEGTTHSRAEIDNAISTVAEAFQPEKLTQEFQKTFIRQAQSEFASMRGQCVTSLANRSGCAATPNAAKLLLEISFRLTPAAKGAPSGKIDFVGYYTFWAEPPALIQPGCITWVARREAGDIFALAEDDGRLLRSRFLSVLRTDAVEMANAMFGDAKLPSGLGWERKECQSWALKLAS